jgi:hypothetical protein
MKVRILNAQIIEKLAQGIKGKIGFQYPEAYQPQVENVIFKSYQNHNGYVGFEMFTPRRPRSTGEKSQNHHFNGHIQQICNETGNDFGQIKLYVKRVAMGMGYPPMVNDKGELVYSLVDGEVLPQSEADSSVEECALLIEAAHIVASEAGVILIEDEG